MNNEFSQIIEDYLGTLEQNTNYLKKQIRAIDNYGGNMPQNKIMIELVTKNLLAIKERQNIMNKELELTLKTLSEL